MSDDWRESIIKNKLGGKTEWTEEERFELCHELDKDMNKSIDSYEKQSKQGPKNDDKWTEDNWKEQMAEHPIFSPFLKEEGKEAILPANELSEGLAQLKYAPEHNSPLEMARNYKDDGVHHFKYKKYRLATASFTEGVKAKCEDAELNAQLYNNRAAAQFFLKNYRSSLKDCAKAIELKPDYVKAMERAVRAAEALHSWDEVVIWCDRGLAQHTNTPFFMSQRSNAIKEKKKIERDLRVERLKSAQQLAAETLLVQTIVSRGVRVRTSSGTLENTHITKRHLEPIHLVAKDRPVHLSECGSLVWPVVLLYPEFDQSDCILEFDEQNRFCDHLDEMFGSEPPCWDAKGIYRPERLRLFYVERATSGASKLIPVQAQHSLKKVLADGRCTVIDGTPEFIVLVEKSNFFKEYISRYK